MIPVVLPYASEIHAYEQTPGYYAVGTSFYKLEIPRADIKE
jgi:hypothetical protein